MIIGQIAPQTSYDNSIIIAPMLQPILQQTENSTVQESPFAGVMQQLSQDESPFLAVTRAKPAATDIIPALQRPFRELQPPLQELITASSPTIGSKRTMAEETMAESMKQTERIPILEESAITDLQTPQNVEFPVSSFLLVTSGLADVEQPLQRSVEVKQEVALTGDVKVEAARTAATLTAAVYAQTVHGMPEQQTVSQQPPAEGKTAQPAASKNIDVKPREAEPLQTAAATVATAQPMLKQPVEQVELQPVRKQVASQAPVVKQESAQPAIQQQPAVMVATPQKTDTAPSVVRVETAAKQSKESVEQPFQRFVEVKQEVAVTAAVKFEFVKAVPPAVSKNIDVKPREAEPLQTAAATVATAQPMLKQPVEQFELQPVRKQVASQAPVVKQESAQPAIQQQPAVMVATPQKTDTAPSVVLAETAAKQSNESVEQPFQRFVEVKQEVAVTGDVKVEAARTAATPTAAVYAQTVHGMPEQQTVTTQPVAEAEPGVSDMQKTALVTPPEAVAGTRRTVEDVYFQTVVRPVGISPATLETTTTVVVDVQPLQPSSTAAGSIRTDVSSTTMEQPAEAVISVQRSAQNVQPLFHTTAPPATPETKGIDNKVNSSDLLNKFDVSEQSPEQGVGTIVVKKLSAMASDNHFSDDTDFAGKDQQPVLTQPVVHSQSKAPALFAESMINSVREGETVASEHLFQQVKENLTTREYKQGVEQISIRLAPENMGELKMTFRMEGQQLKIEVLTENSSARDTLLKHSESLKETLAKQNISMESFNVSTGSGGNSSARNQNDWRELVKQQQYANNWIHGNGLQRADAPSQQLQAYQAKSAYSMVDLHF